MSAGAFEASGRGVHEPWPGVSIGRDLKVGKAHAGAGDIRRFGGEGKAGRRKECIKPRFPGDWPERLTEALSGNSTEMALPENRQGQEEQIRKGESAK